jgi:hypothetical protein
MPEKYQQEIEDILGKINTHNSFQGKLPKRRLVSIIKTASNCLISGNGWPISPVRIIIGILATLLIATLLNARMPGLWIPVASTAIIILICCYAFSLIGTNSTYERRWRGKIIDRQHSWRETIPNWLKRKLKRY